MQLTPQAFAAFAEEYEAGELPDDMLARKWNMSDSVFAETVRNGRGSLLHPLPLKKKKENARGVLHSARVNAITKEGELMPEDMALSPLEASEMLSPAQRMASYALTAQELAFANLVLKGFNTTSAAVACFDIYDEHEARRKASALLKMPRVQDYINELRGQKLYAPIRGKQYLEAVLWQVIDRGMELEQVYDLLGRPVTGRCTYNAQSVIAASAALMKLRGWDRDDDKGHATLSHVERLRMINLNKKGE